jgi:hypothetical protein
MRTSGKVVSDSLAEYAFDSVCSKCVTVGQCCFEGAVPYNDGVN